MFATVKNGSTLARDAIGGVTLRLATYGTTYAATILLARILGAGEFGSYSFYLTAITLLSFPLHLGLANLLLRESAIASSAKDWGKVWGLITKSNRLALIGTVVIWVLMGALYAITSKHGIVDVRLAMLAAILVPIYSLCALRAAVLRANRMPVAGQIPDQLVRPLTLIALVGLFFTFGIEVNAATAMGLTAVAAALGLIIGHGLLKSILPSRPKELAPVEFRKVAWAAFSFLAGATIVNSSIGILYLGIFASEAEVGVYKVADQTGLLVAFVLGSVNLVIAPKVAKLFFEKRLDVLQRLLVASSQLSLAAAIPAFLAFLVFGESFLTLVFGEAYDKAYISLMILAAGQVVSSVAGSVALVMNMSGNEKITLRVAVAGALINILICAWLCPEYGVAGAATASAASAVFWNVALAIFVVRKLGINCTAFGPVNFKALTESH